jgi:nitrate reductase gamma subunit
MIIFGHVLGICFLRGQFTLIGLSAGSSARLSWLLGGITGSVMTLSLVGLITRRLIVPRVKRLSETSDYFELMLLAAVALSGLAMYAPGGHVDLPSVKSYMGGLIAMRPVPLPASLPFVVHISLVNVLLLFFPFSVLMHFVGGFFIRKMLMETPPVYPTAQGNVPRSEFASRRAESHIPVPRHIPVEGQGEQR